MVSFALRQACALCGCWCRGLDIRTVRVNVGSLRSTGPGLVAVDRTCPECRWPTGDQWVMTGLHPDAEPAVAAARDRLRARRKEAAA